MCSASGSYCAIRPRKVLPGTMPWLLAGFCALSLCTAVARGQEILPAIRDSAAAGLRFSTEPTVPEISNARAFDEPLIPIGGDSALKPACGAAAIGVLRSPQSTRLSLASDHVHVPLLFSDR